MGQSRMRTTAEMAPAGAARGEAEEGLQEQQEADELADDGRDRRRGLVGETMVNLETGVEGVGADEVEPDIRVAERVGALEGGKEEADDDDDEHDVGQDAWKARGIGQRFDAGEVGDGGDVERLADGGDDGELEQSRPDGADHGVAGSGDFPDTGEGAEEDAEPTAEAHVIGPRIAIFFNQRL